MNKLFMVLGVLFLTTYSYAALASPTSCSGKWYACHNAFTPHEGQNLSTFGSSNQISEWGGYDFPFGFNVSLNQVKIYAVTSKYFPLGSVWLQASNNNGLTYGPWHKVPTTGSSAYIVDVTNDFSWNTGNVEHIKVKAFCASSSCAIDWLPVYAS